MSILDSMLPWMALLVSIIAVIISYLSSRRARITGIRPVLVFTYDQTIGWTIQNVGNGPALDVITVRRPFEKDWIDPEQINPIARGESTRFGSSTEPLEAFGCTYCDVNGKAYTSIVENNRTKISIGYHLPKWDQDQVRVRLN